MISIGSIFRNHGERADGRIYTESDFENAVDQAIEQGYGGSGQSKAVIDSTGRIYVDGFHVGWVRREASLTELNALAHVFACHLPTPLEMRAVSEGEAR